MSDPIAVPEHAEPRAGQSVAIAPADMTGTNPSIQAAAFAANGLDASAAAGPARASNASLGIPRPAGSEAGGVSPAACGCGCSTGQLVFVLGQLDHDFGTEARRDAVRAEVERYFAYEVLKKAGKEVHDEEGPVYSHPVKPYVASYFTWTLKLDATPIYAIRPEGPYANETYHKLRRCYIDQSHLGVERVAIPGRVNGSTTLLSGQVVPVIQPELMGIANWKTKDLTEAVQGHLRQQADPGEKRTRDYDHEEEEEIKRALDRIYHEFRNLGVTSQDRALNYVATNALPAGKAIVQEARKGYKLDHVEVVRSPICRPDSDCWDVKFTFFNPRKRLEEARTVYRLCVDVSDILPVPVGEQRSWHVH